MESFTETELQPFEPETLYAYELGIKGITVYRNNSRQDQPMLLESAELQTPIHCIDCD